MWPNLTSVCSWARCRKSGFGSLTWLWWILLGDCPVRNLRVVLPSSIVVYLMKPSSRFRYPSSNKEVFSSCGLSTQSSSGQCAPCSRNGGTKWWTLSTGSRRQSMGASPRAMVSTCSTLNRPVLLAIKVISNIARTMLRLMWSSAIAGDKARSQQRSTNTSRVSCLMVTILKSSVVGTTCGTDGRQSATSCDSVSVLISICNALIATTKTTLSSQEQSIKITYSPCHHCASTAILLVCPPR